MDITLGIDPVLLATITAASIGAAQLVKKAAKKS